MSLLSSLIAGLFLVSPASAQIDLLTIERADQSLPLADFLTYQPAMTAARYSLAELRSQSFVALPAEAPTLAAHRDYWFKVRLRNQLHTDYAQAEWVLQFPLMLTDVYYLAVDEKGNVQSGRTGFFTKYAARAFVPNAKGNFVKLHLPAWQTVEVYLRIRSDRVLMGPRYDIKLMSSEFFFHKLKRKVQFNSVFLGFTFLILIYNLFLFILVRDRTYIYYSLYLLALLVFTVYNSGDLADILLPTIFAEEPRWIYFFKLSVYPIIMGYLYFLRSFLDLKDLLPKWDGYFRKFSSVAYAGIVIDSLVMVVTNFNYTLADSFGMVYMILFLVMQIRFVRVLNRTDDPKRYFIIAGVLAMGIGIGLTLIERLITLEFSALAYKVGTIVEVVIFSLGLVYRQREAEQEKQRADFALERATLLRRQKEKEAEQLAELHAAKEWFYTHITHELRTPLTVITGISKHLKDLLSTTSLPEQHQADWQDSVALIERNSEYLHRQVNQLLDLARLEAGAVELHLIEADIITYLAYLTESFYSLATDRDIHLSFASSVTSLVMTYDELKIQQIVFNLLSNALKFSEAGSRVELRATPVNPNAGPFLKIEVADTGIGIPAEDLAGIFAPFTQAGNRHQTVMGTGVGLALTQQLVQLMNGSISVESAPGEGSTFTVLLPVLTGAAPASSVPKVKEVAEPLALAELSSPTPSTPSAPRRSLPLLLIVEDNRDVVTYLEKILAADYRLLIAREGQSGLALARAELPDLIISDVMMPEMDGYDLCRALKTDRLTSHIPLILLTAKAEDTDRLKGLQHGADAYLAKPFHPEELRLRLHNLNSLKSQLQAHYRQRLTTGDDRTDAHPSAAAAPPGVKQEDLDFLAQLSDIVTEHLAAEHLSAAFLATELLLSTNQLYRKLKALINQTPTQYIRDLRLREAQRRLLDTRTPIAEIAYQTGFSDPNYFSRAFQQAYGCSPRAFRKGGVG